MLLAAAAGAAASSLLTIAVLRLQHMQRERSLVSMLQSSQEVDTAPLETAAPDGREPAASDPFDPSPRLE